MLKPGDKVRPRSAPTSEPLTVKHVSPFVEMVEMSEHDGWGWECDYTPDSDPMEELRKFLEE